MDDLKTYHKSSGMFTDIGLKWGIRICAAIHIKGGKLQNTETLPLTSSIQIPVLGEEDHYKFLGKLQSVQTIRQTGV